ncbi:MAG: NAD-dependent epimerase/dehydratase family protein, partial [Burkholderiales bacterium]|nr:NAD-dependent epimerase/dehydratase family protein [Burkholderiales bacterium]
MAGILTVPHQIMPHALVTGATGFVGGHLTNRLMRDGWKVRTLVRDATKLSKHTSEMPEIVAGNLSNPETLATAVRNVDMVFHCAANVATWAPEADYNEVNVLGTDRLLTAIIQNNRSIKRIVHLSTVDVYGFPEMPADEQSPVG